MEQGDADTEPDHACSLGYEDKQNEINEFFATESKCGTDDKLAIHMRDKHDRPVACESVEDGVACLFKCGTDAKLTVHMRKEHPTIECDWVEDGVTCLFKCGTDAKLAVHIAKVHDIGCSDAHCSFRGSLAELRAHRLNDQHTCSGASCPFRGSTAELRVHTASVHWAREDGPFFLREDGPFFFRDELTTRKAARASLERESRGSGCVFVRGKLRSLENAFELLGLDAPLIYGHDSENA